MKQQYGLLIALFLIPSALLGQTVWQSVTNLPYLNQASFSPIGGGAKLRFTDDDFILAWVQHDFYQVVPTLNYARLDLHGSDHDHTSLVPDQTYPWLHNPYLTDFVLKEDGSVLFSLVDDWYDLSIFAHESENDSFTLDYLNQNYPGLPREAMRPSSLAYGKNLFIAAFSVHSSPNRYPYSPLFQPSLSAMHTSSNGITWTASSPITGLNVNEVIFDGERFMAAGYYLPQSDVYDPMNSIGVILSSQDGLDWSFSILHESLNIVAITHDGVTWVAADINGTIFRLQNDSWVGYSPTEDISGVSSMAFGNDFLVIGTSSGNIYSSRDYMTWNLQTVMDWGPVMDVAVGNNSFMAVSPLAVSKGFFSMPGAADIRIHPESRFAIPGEQITLSAVAEGDMPLSYQWYEGESGDESQPVAGATESTFVTPPLNATKHYWVSVSNAVGSDASMTARLTMQVQPQILDQPQNLILSPGQSSLLNLFGTGNNLSYQWYVGPSGDTSLPLTNGRAVNLNVQHDHEGLYFYWVRISNDVGYVDSATALVHIVGTAPQIRDEPLDVYVRQDSPSPLRVAVLGFGPSYQWFAGQSGDISTPINATSSTFWPGIDQPGTYFYWVRVSNDSGYVDSRTAQYTVSPEGEPVITQEPLDRHVYQGDEVSLSVAVAGSSLSYQWYAGERGNMLLPLSATSSFNPPTHNHGAHHFWVRVSNSSGAVSSRTVTVTVSDTNHVGLIKEPQDGWAYQNVSSTLLPMTVHASDAVVTYQWYQGSSGNTSIPLSGATNSSFSPSILTTGTVHYWVRVSGEQDVLDSRTAAFTVLPQLLRITSEPLNHSTFVGRDQEITVSAVGYNVTYQWYSGQAGDSTLPVSGATSPSFYPPATNAGVVYYWVQVSDGHEVVDSRTVTFEVIPQLPVITTQPPDKVYLPTQGISLSVSLQNMTGVMYTWYRGSAGDTNDPITGANSRLLNPGVLPVGTYHFWVRANNAYGSVDSRTAKVLVVPASYSQWLVANGLPGNGTGLGAAGISASGDDHPNLLKYLMGYDALTYMGNSLMETGVLVIGGQSYATLSFRIFNHATSGQLSVDVSSDLVLWQSNAVFVGPVMDHGDGTSTVTYREAQPLDIHPTFFRLRGVQY